MRWCWVGRAGLALSLQRRGLEREDRGLLELAIRWEHMYTHLNSSLFIPPTSCFLIYILIHHLQFVVSTYFWMWDHPLEYSQHTKSHMFKLNWLSLPRCHQLFVMSHWLCVGTWTAHCILGLLNGSVHSCQELMSTMVLSYPEDPVLLHPPWPLVLTTFLFPPPAQCLLS